MRLRKTARLGVVVCLLALLTAGGLQLWGDTAEFSETCVEDSTKGGNGCTSSGCGGICARPESAFESGFVDNCWCL